MPGAAARSHRVRRRHHASANASDAAALLVAGALLGWVAASVRLATPVQAEDQPAASAEHDRTVRQLFTLADQHRRRELGGDPGSPFLSPEGAQVDSLGRQPQDKESRTLKRFLKPRRGDTARRGADTRSVRSLRRGLRGFRFVGGPWG